MHWNNESRCLFPSLSLKQPIMSEVGRDDEERNLLVSVINDVIKFPIWVLYYVTNGQQGPHRWREAVGFGNKK